MPSGKTVDNPQNIQIIGYENVGIFKTIYRIDFNDELAFETSHDKKMMFCRAYIRHILYRDIYIFHRPIYQRNMLYRLNSFLL